MVYVRGMVYVPLEQLYAVVSCASGALGVGGARQSQVATLATSWSQQFAVDSR